MEKSHSNRLLSRVIGLLGEITGDKSLNNLVNNPITLLFWDANNSSLGSLVTYQFFVIKMQIYFNIKSFEQTQNKSNNKHSGF